MAPSLFPLGIFLLTFSHAITLALEDGDVGMMCEPVQQGGNTSGVRKDGVPVFEGEICCQHDGASSFVARIDDVVEEVGGVFVVREIA